MEKKLILGVIVAIVVIVAALFLLTKPATEESIIEVPKIENIQEPAAEPESEEQLIVREPQLQVKSVLARPTSVKAGETLRLLFSVKNAGIGDSPETKINIYVNDNLVSELALRSLLQGESQSIEYAWLAQGDAGNYVAKVSIVPVPGEQVLADNEGQTTFTITA